MIIAANRKRLQEGLFGQQFTSSGAFNGYFADNMGNLTDPNGGVDIRSTISSFSVAEYNTWLFRGFFIVPSTSSTWRFRTTSDDASFLWIGNATAVDTSLPTGNAAVNNGGLHGSQTVTSGNYTLTAGDYRPFAVVVGNLTRPGSLTVEWSSDGGTSWSDDGAGILFHNPYAYNGYNLN